MGTATPLAKSFGTEARRSDPSVSMKSRFAESCFAPGYLDTRWHEPVPVGTAVPREDARNEPVGPVFLRTQSPREGVRDFVRRRVDPSSKRTFMPIPCPVETSMNGYQSMDG
jgi:hypothetical protein